VRDPFEGVNVQVRRALVYVVALAVLLVLWGIWSPTGLAAVGVILCLPLIIMLHELAHFVTAKRTGMKVTEFFVGFGPRIWSIKRGETEYGVKAVLLGGYCKIIGMTNLEDVPAEDESRTYRAKSYPAKVLVASAGSLMHFLIAIVLMFSVLWIAGDLAHRQPTTTLAAVSAGAKDAGLRPGDRVVAIDRARITNWDQVHTAVTGTRADPRQPGDHVAVTVQRGNETVTKDVTLTVDTSTGQKRLIVGIGAKEFIPRLGLGEAIVQAPRQVATIMHESVDALAQRFSPSGIADYFQTLQGTNSTSKTPSGGNSGDNTRFISPAGFGKLSYDAVRAGWVTVVGLLIAINVFVGVFNLVPLLPFDGGHIAIASYEQIASTIRRRRVRVDVAKLMPVTVAVVAVLGFIFLSSLFLDITRPIANPF
jgi:membrane-associated protease RseP (regulator of RpoE activity)